MLKAAGIKRITLLVYTSMFAAIIAVCSLITIPFAVPFTMQTFAVFFSLLMLGGKGGTCAVAIYIALGLAGLPVFSGFNGGFGALLGATGGYIIGFLLASLLFWFIEKISRTKRYTDIFSVTSGMLLCYTVGSLWYALVYMEGTAAGFSAAFMQCVLPFILPDAAKISLAFMLRKRLKKYIQ